jgi:hypothetical protein
MNITFYRLIATCTVVAVVVPFAAEARNVPTITRLSTETRTGNSGRTVDKSRSRLRNDQRRADITTIANAIYSWKRDTKEKLPKSVLLDEKIEICRPTSTSCKGMADLRSIFADYLAEVPVDPLAKKDSAGTRYFIEKDWKDRFTISAPDAEDGWSLRKQK